MGSNWIDDPEAKGPVQPALMMGTGRQRLADRAPQAACEYLPRIFRASRRERDRTRSIPREMTSPCLASSPHEAVVPQGIATPQPFPLEPPRPREIQSPFSSAGLGQARPESPAAATIRSAKGTLP